MTHLRAQRGHGTLVEILLADGDADAAWTEAHVGECSPELWLRLARHREKAHPADALRVYQQQIGPMLTRGGQAAYEEAAGLIKRIGLLSERLGRGDEFVRYRAEVRADHRAKRQFLRLLDAADT